MRTYRSPIICRMSGYYILKNRPRLNLTTMDGKLYVLQQHRIVERVDSMDTENVLTRIWRKITRKMVIKLPAPDWKFAVISIKDFNDYFKPI